MQTESDITNPLLSMRFFITPAHPCNYFPGRQAITLVADPSIRLDNTLYTRLSDCGFRRSGSHVYRPHCPDCRDCIPIRIEAERFEPRRNQRRIWQRNDQLKMIDRPAAYHEEHYALYRRYIQGRHPAGGMDNDDPDQYRHFIQADWCETRLFEIRENGVLLAVAVTDLLENGLSAVYTFYDPTKAERGLGTWAILRQIEECRHQGRKWLYLGYWIPGSPKMQYKSRFRPFEYFDGQRWRPRE